MPTRSPHWPAMKAKYVEGVPAPGGGIAYPSLEELSREFGVSHDRVRKIAARGKWTQERHRLASERERVRRETVLAEEARNLEVFDRDCFTVARAGLRRAAALLGGENGRGVKPSELVAITNAVRGLQVVARVATGRDAGGGGGPDDSGGSAGSGAKVAIIDWSEVVAAARKVNREVTAARKGAGGA